jgi:small GTP-binding protein
MDDGLAVCVATSSPPTFDLTMHGGPRVQERVLRRLDSLGARYRDIRNNPTAAWAPQDRIDADCLSELARAKTQRGVEFLAWQRRRLPAHVAGLVAKFVTDPTAALDGLAKLVARAKAGQVLLQGARIAIVGPPNSGKSTLLNHLAGRNVSIVSPQAGTTRDWVSASIEVRGVPLEWEDTAGDHAGSDLLEGKAILRGRDRAAAAHLVLVVLDGSTLHECHDVHRWLDGGTTPNNLFILNKSDLGGGAGGLPPPLQDPALEQSLLRVSAKTGSGIPLLIDTVLNRLGFHGWSDQEPAFFCHRQAKIASDIMSGPRAPGEAAARKLGRRLLGPRLEAASPACLE